MNVTGVGLGTYARYARCKASLCMPLFPGITLEMGATHFVNPWSAFAMHKRAQELGATAMIITAAGSQLCKMSIKLCLRDGITPICTVRKPE